MKKKISILSVISLVTSAISTAMFWCLLAQVKELYVPWLVLGSLSIFLPLASKNCRSQRELSGKLFEIAALALGFYNFYWVLAIATKINSFFIFIICSTICIAYGKLLDKIPSLGNNKPQSKTLNAICFCRKCGLKLEKDSKFCHKCGTEIEEESE